MKKFVVASLLVLISLADVSCIKTDIVKIQTRNGEPGRRFLCYYKSLADCEMLAYKTCGDGIEILEEHTDEETAGTISTIDTICYGSWRKR